MANCTEFASAVAAAAVRLTLPVYSSLVSLPLLTLKLKLDVQFTQDLENFTESASVSDVHFTGLSSLVSLPLLVTKLE